MNPLIPQAPSGASPQDAAVAGPVSDPGPTDVLQGLHGETQDAANHFDKLGQVRERLDKTREVMDSLVKLGDTVTTDDVMKATASLVTAGVDPIGLAKTLSTMPPAGGEALAGWLQQQDQAIAQKEAALGQMHEAARHDLGVKAMRTLMMHAHMPPGVASASPVTAPPMAAAPGGQNG